MTKRQIIIELRQEFPNTPVRQFARIVYNKNKHRLQILRMFDPIISEMESGNGSPSK